MKKILFVYFLFLSIPSIGQTNLDSLWTVWKDSKRHDTTRLNALYIYSWKSYLFSQPDSSFYFAQMQYDFAKSKGLKKQMANALHNQGASFFVRGDHTKAMAYYVSSLLIREEIGDKKGIAVALNNIGIVYEEQSDYANTIDYYTRSLTISKEIGDKNGIARALLNIGTIYKFQGDNTKAINYYTRSLAIYEDLENKRGIAFCLHNIAEIYREQGDYHNAIDYNTRSLTIKQEIDDRRGISSSLTNIGRIYEALGDSNYTAGNTELSATYYTKALDYQNRSLLMAEDVGYKRGISISSRGIGSIHYKQDNNTNAIKYSYKSLKLAQEIGHVGEVRDAAYQLYNIYKTTGNINSALDMHELYIATRDSINSENNQREVIRQEYKYEYEKQAIADSVANVQKQKVQEAELEKSKTQQFALLGGLILLIGFSGFMYNRFRVIRKQNIIIEKQQLDKMKLIEAKAVYKERDRISRELHDNAQQLLVAAQMGLNNLVKKVDKLDDKDQKTFKTSQELLRAATKDIREISHEIVTDQPLKESLQRKIKNIIDPIQNSDSIDFKFEYNLDKELTNEQEIGILRMVQECISNILKHAKASQVSISITEQNGNYLVTIRDNGIGFDVEKNTGGIGMKNLQKRARELNGSIDIDSISGSGTSVRINIPLS